MYDVLKPVIPALSRSNLHRCLQRNGVSRIKDLLPEEEQKQPYKAFKDYAPGYLHIDTAEVRIGEQKQYLLVAIDRVIPPKTEVFKSRTQHKPCTSVRGA
jgi:hypothetical protein